MAENKTRETCSISRCMSAAVHSEYGEVGHWMVTIFFCDEHWRDLEVGTPLGPIGVEPEKVRVESLGTTEIPSGNSRVPGID